MFIKDSIYYKAADDYAHGPDITFISDHRLSNPTYTDVVVDNYIVYSDNCYSLHISETTNMVLTRTGEARQDKIDSVFYFVNYDDTDDGEDNPRWCIVDMIAVTNTAEGQ